MTVPVTEAPLKRQLGRLRAARKALALAVKNKNLGAEVEARIQLDGLLDEYLEMLDKPAR